MEITNRDDLRVGDIATFTYQDHEFTGPLWTEGVAIRAEGITPKVAKFKNPLFYEHEEIGLSKGEADIEDAAS